MVFTSANIHSAMVAKKQISCYVAKPRPFKFVRNFDEFLTTNILSATTESAILWAMIGKYDVIDGAVKEEKSTIRVLCESGYPETITDTLHAGNFWQAPASAQQAQAQPIYWLGGGDYNLTLPNGISPDIIKVAKAAEGPAFVWLINLIGAHQIKPLNASNIKSYFQSKRNATIQGTSILRWIDFAASQVPHLMSDTTTRDDLEKSVWMTYHTSFSSTPKLAQQMIQAYPTLIPKMLTADEIATIEEAVSANFDEEKCKAIPERAILMTLCYLQVHKRLPENWFQGARAEMALPGPVHQMYTEIFKEAMKRNSIKDALAECKSMDEFLKVVESRCKGGA